MSTPAHLLEIAGVVLTDDVRPAVHDPASTPVAVRPQTDLGNAERLHALYGPDMRWCPDSEEWFVWVGTHWEADQTETTRRWAATTVRRIPEEIPVLVERVKRKAEQSGAAVDGKEIERVQRAVKAHARKSESTGRLTAMLREARALAGVPMPSSSMDTQMMLLNVENGTVDLSTGTLREHRRADKITKMAPVRFDDRARCPRWLQFLDRTFCGDAELIRFMQRVTGYALTGDVSEQVLVVMHGGGSNGKSTFVEVLFALLGPYAQSAPQGMLVESRSDRHPTELARLRGARLVAAMETKQDIKLDEPLVKQLTGGDTITARFMRGDFFEFSPTHTMLMATNHKPRIHGTDHGIWRRLRLVPFEATITEAEKDRNLKAKLLAELPGILNWAIAGCMDWQRDGLGEPESVMLATAEYKAEMDLIGNFIAECLVVDPDLRLEMKMLYDVYKTWALDNGHRPMAANRLSRDLNERGFVSDKMDRTTRVKLGLGLPPRVGR